MDLRDYEIEMADAIASRVLAGLVRVARPEALAPDQAVEAQLTEALGQANGAIWRLTDRIGVVEAVAAPLCDVVSDSAVRAACAVPGMAPELVVRLRKIQQHMDSLREAMQ